ncbi:MAG: hypothetical protein ACI4CZ_03170 [Hominisplanchenecus sp.]
MNQLIPKIGAVIVAVTVFLFAVCLIFDFLFGSYLVCMLLPIGYIMMVAGFHHECCEEQRVSANIGLVFSAIYAVLIFLVYFAQTTSVRLEDLNEQAIRILNYQRGGLLFNYDLLGYGMMALSTFFIGLSIKADSNSDKWLKCLMMIHGFFFIGCFIIPMTGVFISMSDGKTNIGGVAALVAWCAYFLPIGILACRHFGKALRER